MSVVVPMTAYSVCVERERELPDVRAGDAVARAALAPAHAHSARSALSHLQRHKVFRLNCDAVMDV